ncbi:hypothetical protein ACLRGF_02450 [Mycetocola zhadangensis]|uniref:hypothetical protein n=1 Tax=Mycetocola zhadangensis TaxID=1164595 RepID=UPI003A4DD2E6
MESIGPVVSFVNSIGPVVSFGVIVNDHRRRLDRANDHKGRLNEAPACSAVLVRPRLPSLLAPSPPLSA